MRVRPAPHSPAILLTCAALAACGGSSSHTGSSVAQLAAGRRLFDRSCSACHSIAAGARPSQQGGDLRSFHATRRQLRELAGEMPVIHPPALSAGELTDVVDYVMAIEAGHLPR